jgi:uncharacterized protein YegJ (DUF2314 family)
MLWQTFGLGGICIAALTSAVVACKTKDEGSNRTVQTAAPQVAGSAVAPAQASTNLTLAPRFHFEIGVFHVAAVPPTARANVAKLLTDAGLTVLTDVDATSPNPSVHVVDAPLANYAVPSLEYLKLHGRDLSEATAAQLQQSAAATLLVFDGPVAAAVPTYRAAMRAAQALENAGPGAIMDDSSRNVYSGKAWGELLTELDANPPRSSAHFMIDAYQDDALLRLVTIGMQKFGLPDLVVENVTNGMATSMAKVINLVAQTLLEGGVPDGNGELAVDVASLKSPEARAAMGKLLGSATGRGRVTLRLAKRAEGDADNLLWVISFAGPHTAQQERQAALVQQLFGLRDEVSMTTHDATVLAASERARAKAILLKPKFRKRPPEREHLRVKAPFKTTSGGNEWMWVEVVSWRGRKLEGFLDNTPDQVPSLKLGAKVTVNEAEIFDYIYTKADGTEEGNETQALMLGE